MTNTDGSGNQAPVKLRASCNACNESKVRCSQTKPTCDRCKKTGMPCVFGLSRRSHKDAPRIMSSSRPAALSGIGAIAPRRPSNESAAHMDDSVFSTVTALCAFHDFNVFSQYPAAAVAPNCGQIPRSADLLAGFRDRHGDLDGVALWPFNQSDPMDFLSTGGGGLEPPVHSASLDAGTWGSVHEVVSPHPLSPQPLVPQVHSPSQSRSNQQPRQQQQEQQQQQYEQTHPQPYDQHDHTHAQDPASSPGVGACTCSSRVIPDLARKSQAARNQGAGKPLSFDVELSRLKQAIMACEASMVCQSHSSDPTVTMIIGFLIGDIVDGFKALLSGSSPATNTSPSSSSSSSVATTDSGSNAGLPITTNNSNINKKNSASSPASSTRGVTLSEGVTVVSPGVGTGFHRESSMTGAPRLRWGVLQLEDDDEVELRHSLCLLYFRRLRGLLKHFDQAVRQFREAEGATGSSTATFIMACDYVRMWLEQKVEAVKDLFNDTDR